MTSNVLELPEIFKIDAVEEVHKQMDVLLSQDTPLEISADSVTSIDFCALQLLAVTQATLAQQESSIIWRGTNDFMREAVERAGMSTLLGATE